MLTDHHQIDRRNAILRILRGGVVRGRPTWCGC